jgi:hypothetical protein
MRNATPHPALAALLRRVLRRLEDLQPERENGDTLWAGPFFIPRRGEWWPSRFLRYRNELYCTLEFGWSTVRLVWDTDGDDVSFEGSPPFGSGYVNGPDLWKQVLEQVAHRLARAVRNFAAYNRHVARLLPLSCRTGRIKRRLTWPVGSPRPLPAGELARLERALARGKRARSWRSLSVRRYLGVAALAYDAVFDELKRLAPREKYERKADTRHGGMLELAPNDSAAFARWYSSRQWSGAHPWEIVFAHPHGVLLYPLLTGSAWRFALSVDTLGLYVATARMAIAIGARDIPFELVRAPEVMAALRGDDWVEVGPFYGQLALEELQQRRNGAAKYVAWDPPPVLRGAATGRRSRSSEPVEA